MPKKLTTEEFIKRCNLMHGSSYDYSNVDYKGTDTKVIIRCTKHDVIFHQTPHAHMHKKTLFGCNVCAENKKKHTCLKNHGVENVLKSQKIRKQTKQTNLDRYGVEHAMQSASIKEKTKQTNLDRYGVENPMQSASIKEKTKQTNLDRYGVEYIGQHVEFMTKARQTNLQTFGFEHAMQSALIKEKAKISNLLKYNVDHSSKLDITQQKKNQTNLERYGVEHFMQSHIDIAILSKLNNYDWLKEEYVDNKKSSCLISNELGISDNTVLRYLKKHNIKIQNGGTSDNERMIVDFIIELLPTTKIVTNIYSIIPPYELDIYIPEHNIAIEYNGLYWHSEAAGKTQNYHLNKTKLCEEKGIRLIHIFEDEWLNNQQKCKDTLRHLLGKSPKGIYARNTIIREIPWKQAKEFLNEYHLLNAGTCGNYRIGAFDKNGNLIGVMVFGIKNNEGNDKSIELKRFVTNKKNNPGLGSKMFKYATINKKYTEVVAFVDRRWFTGLVKSYIGFKQTSITKPALWWTNGRDRNHRRFITKKQLELDGYDISVSKKELLQNLGFSRIWDCGKIKLQWNVN